MVLTISPAGVQIGYRNSLPPRTVWTRSVLNVGDYKDIDRQCVFLRFEEVQLELEVTRWMTTIF